MGTLVSRERMGVKLSRERLETFSYDDFDLACSRWTPFSKPQCKELWHAYLVACGADEDSESTDAVLGQEEFVKVCGLTRGVLQASREGEGVRVTDAVWVFPRPAVGAAGVPV